MLTCKWSSSIDQLVVTEPDYLKSDEPFLAAGDKMRNDLQSLHEEIAVLENDYQAMSQLVKIVGSFKRQYVVRNGA